MCSRSDQRPKGEDCADLTAAHVQPSVQAIPHQAPEGGGKSWCGRFSTPSSPNSPPELANTRGKGHLTWFLPKQHNSGFAEPPCTIFPTSQSKFDIFKHITIHSM